MCIYVKLNTETQIPVLIVHIQDTSAVCSYMFINHSVEPFPGDFLSGWGDFPLAAAGVPQGCARLPQGCHRVAAQPLRQGCPACLCVRVCVCPNGLSTTLRHPSGQSTASRGHQRNGATQRQKGRQQRATTRTRAKTKNRNKDHLWDLRKKTNQKRVRKW